jgi:hypothetical protein
LAPTVGIAATGFCYPGGILQLFSSTRSSNFSATNSSSQIALIDPSGIRHRHHPQDLHRQFNHAGRIDLSSAMWQQLNLQLRRVRNSQIEDSKNPEVKIFYRTKVQISSAGVRA